MIRPLKLSLKTLTLSIPLLALPWIGGLAHAQTLNPPAAGTGPAGPVTYYTVPIGYQWDHMSYDTNPGDWNIAIGDSGFDAGEIPESPEFCPNGACPTSAGPMGPAFITHNNDTTHGYSKIPVMIGPTQDGFNNTETGHGQAIPVVPGSYVAAFVTYSGVNGPHSRPVILNYADGTQIINFTWADWCAAVQAPPDFFTWIAKHRNNGTGQDGNSCALITKYIPINPARTLNSITLEADQAAVSTVYSGNNGHAGGAVLPGDTITSGAGRTVIGSVTLASTNATLPQYGLVTGHITMGGATQTTPPHAHIADSGFDVFVLDPPLGNYAAGANVDGSYTLGLPAGTYKLSAAVRGGSGSPGSAGPQAKPVTVVVASGATVTQNMDILAAPDATQWSELTGTVKDSMGNPVNGAAILLSSSANGPFTAVGIPGQALTITGGTMTGAPADGSFDIPGLGSGTLFVKAATNGAASAAASMVTMPPGGSATVALTVAPLPIGNVVGTVVTPDMQFGGVSIPVTLVSMDGKTSLRTTTVALPPLNGTGTVPEMNETSTFSFEAVPSGTYTLSLPTDATEGAPQTMQVTVMTGGTLNPVLVLNYPAFAEGTADTKLSDTFQGASLNSKWTSEDVNGGANLMATGTAKEDSSGLTVTGGGIGWDKNTTQDQFQYVHQPLPAGDFVATVTLAQLPMTGEAALMIHTDTPASANASNTAGITGLDPFAGSFAVGLDAAGGVIAHGRVGDYQRTFPFREALVTTDPAMSGTLPSAPVTLKIRRVGATYSAFYSNDAGKTQHFVGQFSLSSDPAHLFIGPAVTANVNDGTTDSAKFTNFTYAPAAPAVTVLCGDLNGDNKISVPDATIALRIAVGIVMPSAAQTAAACGNTINVAFATRVLRVAVGLATSIPPKM